tara:strand:+ start:411 stop:620 length:210 start_codon:yes stop_codon:yes gene_type:complete
MPYTSNTKAFLAWRECIRNQKDLRLKLTLPDDKEEDYRMCRARYKAYMKENLKATRKELGIKDQKSNNK